MPGFFLGFFDRPEFGPGWNSGTGANLQGWQDVLVDLVAWSAYMVIPAVLAYWVIRRKDLPNPRRLWLPSVLVVACGVTHLIATQFGWYAPYRFAFALKLTTAVAAWGMVLGLLPWLPKVTTHAGLEEINSRLERELQERQLESEAAQQREIELELKLEQRTAELRQANEALQAEVKQRRLAEQNLLSEFSDKWSKVNQELDDLAYIASHDLKEPLRGISNFSSFLIEDYGDKLDEEGCAKLRTLQNLSERLELLIDSMLEFSRVGRVEMAMKETDLNELVAGVLASVRTMLNERSIEVRIPRRLPTVTCDDRRTLEVFRNLITNAVKYNDKPERWIEIGYYEQPSSDEPDRAAELKSESGNKVSRRTLVLYVRDNGIGIHERHQASIFRIFRRLHGRDRFGGGTGAGLTIAKRIVERHQGRIWVESKHGEGSTFHFMLSGGHGT